MKIILRFILIIACTLSVEAFSFDSNVDVYGTSEKISNEIIKIFGEEIKEHAEWSLPEKRKTPVYQAKDREIIKQKIIKKIKEKYKFSYVNISPILYHDGTVFSTIDVIEQKDAKRLAYINTFNSVKFNLNIQIPEALEKLIAYWDAYMERVEDLFLKQELLPVRKCPAYHCIADFEQADLKKYQLIFDTEVPKQKDKLIEILKTDPNEKRRATSVFLLAHIKEGNELIEILLPFLRDPNKTVRNNVMRVLSSALDIVKPDHFNMHPIIQALDSPILTDRNKALAIMISLGSKPEYAHYMAKHARLLLIRSLKMKQPNLHANAYGVLMNMSGKKSYGEYDYSSWDRWLLEQAKNKTIKGVKI